MAHPADLAATLPKPRPLTPAEHASLPGQFLPLSDGYTHYELAGPADGQPVVLIHGFSTPYSLWDPTFPALVQAGFRTLRYDLYGRGFSDRPAGEYDAQRFDRQLLELLDGLHITAPVDLIGSSMGGALAAIFADRHPERVRRLVFVDPAGSMARPRPDWSFLLFTPPVRWLLKRNLNRILLAGLPNDFHDPDRFPEYYQQYAAQLVYDGLMPALLSTLKSNIIYDHAETFRRVGQQKRPVLLLWGRDDHTISYDIIQEILAAFPQAEFHVIEEAGHIPHYEQPEVVNNQMIQFLNKG
jgi:pimeloyl-ACP methyl ester carboxylesterase